MKKSPRRLTKKPAKSINRIYIDQSGKVEYTNKQTVVAYSNGRNKALFISSISKKKIQKVFRDAGKPDLFAYRTFAILIYLLIKEDLNKLSIITIDRLNKTKRLGFYGWVHLNHYEQDSPSVPAFRKHILPKMTEIVKKKP